MEGSDREQQGNKRVCEVTTFSVPFSSREMKENITISTNSSSKPSKEQIINQAFNFHSEGNIQEAAKYYQYFIDQGFTDHRVFSNYGTIFKNHGKSQEAEILTRKAIELKPNFADAHNNLGNILKDLGRLEEAESSFQKAIELNPEFVEAHYNLGNTVENLGKLQEAELSHRKAIELNPDFARAYFSLSGLNYNNIDNKIWQDKLFSESILNNKLQKDYVDIYFARANILHKEKSYKESAKFLKLANNLKLDLNPSNSNLLLNKSELLLIESDKRDINQIKQAKYPQSLFIVGMPRCGSTLIESILSMNSNINDLGEINIFEKSYIEWNKIEQELTLADVYWKKVTHDKSELNITTNKCLYNYQYAGIISSQIANAKIIHCYRNPLDNILSIYRAHFSKGNEYSSSLVDCAKVYLDQEKIMLRYKNRFRSKIYDLNYDKLVRNPKQEIKSLISWLKLEWDNSYLTPHLNPRSISTASSVQVRSPINSKSIGGWKNYKDLLDPAIKILTRNDKYLDINSYN